MFGLYRTILALMVVGQHLLSIPGIGGFAVFAFFSLSGYLMTSVMHKSYGYDTKGIRGFAINRFLRLYPTYWIACIICVVVILICGERFTKEFRPSMYMPRSTEEILQNLTIVFLSIFPNEVQPRLSPPTWALTNEIFFYLLIALGISKTRMITTLWFLLGIFYVILVCMLGLPSSWHYYAVPAASLPFSVGALLYFYEDEVYLRLPKIVKNADGWKVFASYLILCATFSLCSIGMRDASSIAIMTGIYCSLLFSTIMIVKLNADGLGVMLSKAVDKLVGEFSYPIYVMHWPVAGITSWLLFDESVHGASIGGAIVTTSTCVLIVAISMPIIFVLDPYLQGLRNNFRVKAHRERALGRTGGSARSASLQ